MTYTPHILLKKVTQEQRDGYGRIIQTSEEWVNVAYCRCDDNSTSDLRSDNGEVYRPKYHVVCEGKFIDVKTGDYLRCIYPDGRIRAEGKCEQIKVLNFLPFSELWM